MTTFEVDRADADSASASLLHAITFVCGAVGNHGFIRNAPGVVAFVTGGRLPSFNSVAVSSVDADPGTVCAFYDEVVATSLPHCVQVRPAVESRIEHILVKRGLARVEEIPLMARLGTQPPG